MNLIPLRTNTITITTLAMIAAVGIVVRLTVRLVLIPGLVEITPGFLFSELGGVIGGIPGGALVGTIVGLGGAIAGGETPLLPLIGNICLGIGTGYAIHIVHNRDSLKYALLVIIGGGVIGGLLPSFAIFILTESFGLAFAYALLDFYQALGWAAAALLTEAYIIRPVIGNYLYLSD
jgi:hypothetical protein